MPDPRVPDWDDVVRDPGWGLRVAKALQRYFSEGGPILLDPITLLEVRLDGLDPDGVPVIRTIYERGHFPGRLGYRRRLDRAPASGEPFEPLEDWMAEWIAVFDISEPLGRKMDLLVKEDDGVSWWGDGYPDLTQHPHYPAVQRQLNAVLEERGSPFRV
jgi:hypothetical protein